MPPRKEAGTHIYANTYTVADIIDFRSDFYFAYCKHKKREPVDGLLQALADETRTTINIYISKRIATLKDNDHLKTVTERKKELSGIYRDICRISSKRPQRYELYCEADYIRGLCYPLKYTSAKSVLTDGFENLPNGSFINFDFLNHTGPDDTIYQHLLHLRQNISKQLENLRASTSEPSHFSDMILYCLKIWDVLFQGVSVESKYPYGHSALAIFSGIMPSLRLPNRKYRGDNTVTTIFYEWLCSLFLQIPDAHFQRLCPTNNQTVEFITHIYKNRRLRYS